MADFNDDDIKAARALCDAATPGPWIEQLGFPLSHIVGVTCDEALEVRDAEFIAAARTLLPAALDALESARRERDEALADKVRSLAAWATETGALDVALAEIERVVEETDGQIALEVVREIRASVPR